VCAGLLKNYPPRLDLVENQKIGVIDIEVYKNNKLNKEKVYSAGLSTRYTNEKLPTLFYMDKYLNSDNVIFNLINEMLRYVLSKPQNN
jgi:hypothetical protein